MSAAKRRVRRSGMIIWACFFPEAYGTGNKITLRCSFEGDGAPMLIISLVNEVDEQGVFRTLEYYEIVDGNTLQPIAAWDDTSYVVGCITVYCGKVRLIDNIRYK